MENLKETCRVAVVQAAPVWDWETVIYADLDMARVPMRRMEFDVCGHYARPDVLELTIHESLISQRKGWFL